MKNKQIIWNCYSTLYIFWLVPKKNYKPVLQYPCKLDPAEAAIISNISHKYSLVRKGPSNNQN